MDSVCVSGLPLYTCFAVHRHSYPAPPQTDRIAESALLDEKRLNKLGYKQELQRKLSYFHNFGVAISFLSPITGLTGARS